MNEYQKSHLSNQLQRCLTAKNDKNLSNAYNPSAQSDQSQNDSNIIDEDSNLEGAQTKTDNSTSSIDSQAADPFSLVGM